MQYSIFPSNLVIYMLNIVINIIRSSVRLHKKTNGTLTFNLQLGALIWTGALSGTVLFRFLPMNCLKFAKEKKKGKEKSLSIY